MELSKHFTLAEFTASSVAARYGIDNMPGAQAIENLKRLAAVMEDVRGILGKPIIITSGYRCSRLNKLVGGRPNSKHVDGLACDFICPPWSIPEIIAAMQNSAIPFDQCIMEFYNPATGDGWAHVGLGANPRRQVLTVNRMGTFAGIQI